MRVTTKNINETDCVKTLNEMSRHIDVEWDFAKKQWDMAHDLHDNLQRGIKRRFFELKEKKQTV